MNRRRRELLKSAKGHLVSASMLVSRALDEEEDCLGNTPDNLLDSSRHEKMEHAVDALTDAQDSIDDAIDKIGEAVV